MTHDAQLLARRTEALARRIDESAVVLRTLLVLHVSGERFALEPAAVRLVTELRRVTPLPHVPLRVLGLTAHAGTVIPVFDLRAVLGLPLTTLPEYGRIVICGDPGDEVALAVEAVHGEAGFDDHAIAPLPSTAGPGLRAFARGVAPGGIVVLDHEALLSSDLLSVDAAIPR